MKRLQYTNFIKTKGFKNHKSLSNYEQAFVNKVKNRLLNNKHMVSLKIFLSAYKLPVV